MFAKKRSFLNLLLANSQTFLGDARHRRGICTFTNGVGVSMRQIEKTITATTFSEAVAELKAFAKSQLAGILAPQNALSFAQARLA